VHHWDHWLKIILFLKCQVFLFVNLLNYGKIQDLFRFTDPTIREKVWKSYEGFTNLRHENGIIYCSSSENDSEFNEQQFIDLVNFLESG
jgi:hypothetical protein